MDDEVMFVCESCQTICALQEADDEECEGDGFYELPGDDISCPCCGDAVGEPV